MKTLCFLLIVLITSPAAHAQQYQWSIVGRPTSRLGLAAVSFTDSLHGWCAGLDSIYQTADGGTTWCQTEQPYVPNSIVHLSFLDTLRGWAVGRFNPADGIIWQTRNAGKSWTESVYSSSFTYGGIWAFDSLKAIAIGDSASSYTLGMRTTTDGGASWAAQYCGDSVGGFYSKIFFADHLHGWVTVGVTNHVGAILRTNDGGKNWSLIFTPDGFVTISFIDSLRGWATRTNSTKVYRTTDGGETWEFQYDISFGTHDELGARALCFVDSLNGWVFGGGFYQGIISEDIYRTTDGGWTWMQESIGLTGDFGDANGATMLSRTLGWAACGDGSVLKYGLVTGVAEKVPDIPAKFKLYQNYPNPFNPTTTIEYEIIHREQVRISVYNVLGEKISTLVDQIQESGKYRVRFDGSTLPSGVYYYAMKTNTYTSTNAMLLVK